MKVLIDGKEYKADNDGKAYTSRNHLGELVPSSFHSVIQEHAKDPRKNIKCASHGHVYVLNYDAASFTKKYPMTFAEFKSNGYKF